MGRIPENSVTSYLYVKYGSNLYELYVKYDRFLYDLYVLYGSLGGEKASKSHLTPCLSNGYV